MARRTAGSRTQPVLPFSKAQPGKRKSRAAAGALGREERRVLMESLSRDGARIAAHFDLRFRAILAERAGVVGHYGICYEDGVIKIRLQHATRGTPLKYSSLVNTLCHELAHLKYFDHQESFRRLYAKLLEWARRQGIYRPRGVVSEGRCGLSAAERREVLESMRQAVAGRRRGEQAAGNTQFSLFESRLDPSG